jgi:hypothetical protein
MKLTYRGVSYDYNPPKVEYGDRSQAVKYRGVDIRFRSLKKPPVLQPTLDLIYRGVAQTTNPTNSATAASAMVTKASAPEASISSVKAQARFLMVNHHRAIKNRQQSMLSRLDAEVGMLNENVELYWNHIQGKVHPTFGDNYDRSHVALS